MISKIEQAQKAVQQEDPLSLYEELFLISPSWADQLFRTDEPRYGLNDSRSCVVGEAHHGNCMYPNKEYTARCRDCSESSIDIYQTSKEWRLGGLCTSGKEYNEDEHHAQISKFVNHFKQEHRGPTK